MSPPDLEPIVVDARGHRCPVPTLRLRRAMALAGPGRRLVLLADDPMARIDAPHLLAQTGGALIAVEDRDDTLVITVETPGVPTVG